MDITAKDARETKALGLGQRISIAIGIVGTTLPALLAAFGGLDYIAEHLPLLITGLGSLIGGGFTAYVAIHRMRVDAGRAGAVLLFVFPLLLASTGCNTVNKDNIEAGAGWAEKYYNQPNVAPIWVIENTNANQVAEFTVKNFTRFEMSTPVPPKSIIPRDPTWYEGIFDTAKTVAPWIMMGWMVHDSGGLGKSTSSSSTTTISAQ